MKCLRCGYCCMNLCVVVVDDPEKGTREGNLKWRDGKSRCQHLKGDKPGEYSCGVHGRKWYKKTPCFSHGQIEQSPNAVCRMGEYILRGKKLWLDDERTPPDGSWTWCRTGEEAVELLSASRVCEISFDHDLGDGMSGYDVATRIEELASDGRIDQMVWRVHSANPVGKKRIVAAMESADGFWNRKAR